MGLRGPKPKPVEEQILRGNPGKRKLNENQESPANVAGDISLFTLVKPKWMNKQASTIWDELIPLLVPGQILAQHSGLLARYCMMQAELDDICKKMSKGGAKMQVSGGEYRKSSLVKIHSDLQKDHLKIAEQLGLTPKALQSRGIVVTAPKREQSTVDATKTRTNIIRLEGKKDKLEGSIPARPRP